MRNLETNHPDLKNKPVEYFERLKAELKVQRTDIDKFAQSGPAAIRSSFYVAYHIARAKKPFKISTNLIKPILLDVTREMFGEVATSKINSIPLSDNTISRRINSMAADIEEQLCEQIKNSGCFAV